MSWGYWGIVIGLGALILMVVACMRLLASKGTEARQELDHEASGSMDMHPDPPTIHRRAA